MALWSGRCTFCALCQRELAESHCVVCLRARSSLCLNRVLVRRLFFIFLTQSPQSRNGFELTSTTPTHKCNPSLFVLILRAPPLPWSTKLKRLFLINTDFFFLSNEPHLVVIGLDWGLQSSVCSVNGTDKKEEIKRRHSESFNNEIN